MTPLSTETTQPPTAADPTAVDHPPVAAASPFDAACAEALRRHLYLEAPPSAPPDAVRRVVRPFFIVCDPLTGERQEVAFNGRRLLCACGAVDWCAHQAAVWAQVATSEPPPTTLH